LSSTAERKQLVRWGVNDQRFEAADPVHRLIERQVEQTPDAIALVFEDQQLSYAELNTRANQLAHRLIKLGIGPETRVGIAVERSIEMVVGLLAILKAGGAYVPLDPEYPAERLAYMIEDSGVTLLLTQSHLQDRLTRLLTERAALEPGSQTRKNLEAGLGIAPTVSRDPHSSLTEGALAGVAQVERAVSIEGSSRAVSLRVQTGSRVPENTPAGREPLEAQPLIAGHGGWLMRTPPQSHGVPLLFLALDRLWLSEEPAHNPTVDVHGEQLAYVIYTSGSTGKPKGVMIRHHALSSFLQSMQEAPGLCAEDVLVAVTSLSFDIAALELYLPLICGARLALASREITRDGVALARLIEQSGATVVQSTPAGWRMLRAAGWPHTALVRFKGLCGGEALPADLMRDLRGCGVELWNLYGPTETTIWSAALPVQSDSPAIGGAIAGTQLHVLDGQLNAVPAGVAGELYLGGAGLARGYVQRPVLTAERFIADPHGASGERLYRTGDLVRWRSDGQLEYLGRIDQQVKIRGFRIELGEIEAQLLAQPEVREAVVVAHESTAGPQLVAYISAKSDTAVDVNELRAQLSRVLPEYMVPSAIVVLDRLPLNSNGKIDRKALPSPRDIERNDDPPHGEAEQAVADIWREVLGTERIGRHDDFFALGGHSLLLLKLLSLLQQRFAGTSIAFADLISFPKLHAQAQRISAQPAVSEDLQVVSLTRGGDGITLFCFPGTYGNGSEFTDLAKALEGERLVQSFVCHTLGPHRWDRSSIPEIAADYARHIAANSKGQGCALLGWSFGGDLAFEAARQLQRIQPVRFLGVVDVTDRRQILALGRTDNTTTAPSHERITDWIDRSAMKSRWHQLLNDMSSTERHAVLDFLAADPLDLPTGGPAIDSKEYDMWVVIRLSWMKRRYAAEVSRVPEMPLHNWTAQATAQDERLCPRDWSLVADIELNQEVPGTTHKSILSHERFINGVRNALRAADAMVNVSQP
jgi:amino acid adenylation domain-containing protein